MSRWAACGCRIGVGALIACFCSPLVLSVTSAAAAARPITISGSISGIPGGRVFVLSAQGFGWTGVISGKSFKVLVPAKDRAKLLDATVQVVAASGRYVGPVVLKRMVEKKNPACGRSNSPACIDDVIGLGKASGDVSLGRLAGENVAGSIPTWFLASNAESIDVRDAVRAAARNGRPYGAGNLGLVPRGIPTVSLRKANAKAAGEASGHFVSADSYATSLPPSPLGGDWLPLPVNNRHDTVSLARDRADAVSLGASPVTGSSPANGTVSESCTTTTDPLDSAVVTKGTSAGTAPGQELDCSGVPNMFNTDVNGNEVMNNVDPAASSIAASAITIGAKEFTAESTAISYYAPGGVSPSTMATFLGGAGHANFSFNANSDQLFPGDFNDSGVTMSADCGTVAWCANATLLSMNSGMVVGPWAKTSPPYAFATNPSGGFGAAVNAPPGTDIPAQIVPGQVIGVKGVQQSSGATAESMMEVGPYFASTPYVQGATFSGPSTSCGCKSPGDVMLTDSAGKSVDPVGSGTLTLKVERPERPPLPGETTSSGVMDMAGLGYDISISGPGKSSAYAYCPATAISDISGATVVNARNDFAGFALVDNTTQDFDPAAANNPGPITFTVNPSACATSGGVTWSAGNEYGIGIVAQGLARNDSTNVGFSVNS